MAKYKVCVYAICKNEEKFVKRWFNSMKEADEIIVLDTGSTDNTVKLLKKLGATVYQKTITPWRFDKARNLSLSYVPLDTDICVCTDLDEIFEINWRRKLEKVWQKKTTKCLYTYNWSLNENNIPQVSFFYEKIHNRNDYSWIYPVHEVLMFNGQAEIPVIAEAIVLNHYPDQNKSRSSYLKLLKLAVKENPLNDRLMHYLGREYMYYQMWTKSINTLIKHLALDKATWKDERSASMRYIARCYKALKHDEKAIMWLKKAIREAPYLKEPYIELAFIYYNLKDYIKVQKYCLKSLKITKVPKTYINEPFSHDETVYFLLAISYYYQKKYHQALANIELSLIINPNNKRLLTNKEIITKQILSNK